MITMLITFVLPFTQPSTASRAPEAVVRAMFDAFNRHDAQTMQRLYSSDARLTSSDFCAPRGKADIRRTYDALFSAFPDIHDTVEILVSEGDRVAVRFTATSQRGNLKLPIHTFLRVRNGLIAEDDSVFDAGGRPCTP